ncbi:ribosomal protein L7/L12 [Hamadaea tsunoensis]|uniref:ribosomal protein L7/L12 n=1 Tax=Hamadaea tsunoensis TaxID=53368 RepID=UPI000425C648|nr:ribosomal protein L7/L12 [Hamadaea tsunoensis]
MTFVWIAALVVVAVVAYAIGRASRKGGDLVGDQLDSRKAAAVTPPSADLNERARQLTAQGKKIQAIKEYREATGLGLLDAKEAVERLAAGAPVEPVSPQTTAELGDLATQARALKQSGEIIRAVKLVRTATGLSLKDAKDFVDDL